VRRKQIDSVPILRSRARVSPHPASPTANQATRGDVVVSSFRSEAPTPACFNVDHYNDMSSVHYDTTRHGCTWAQKPLGCLPHGSALSEKLRRRIKKYKKTLLVWAIREMVQQLVKVYSSSILRTEIDLYNYCLPASYIQNSRRRRRPKIRQIDGGKKDRSRTR